MSGPLFIRCHGDDFSPGCRMPTLMVFKGSTTAIDGAAILKIDPTERITVRCGRPACGVITVTHGRTKPSRKMYDPGVALSPRDLGYPALQEMVRVMEERWDAFRLVKLRERGSVAVGLRFDVFMRDGFRCRYCGRSIDEGIVLHADHVIPESKGGPTTLDNLVTSCMDCNWGKSDKELMVETVLV